MLSLPQGHAQQRTIQVVGLLSSAEGEPTGDLAAAFRRGLSEEGYVEGRNVVIEYRQARGRYDLLPELVDDLVHRQVAVIVTTGGAVTALAAKAASSKIPIVFASGDDPVQVGLVSSLNRPGGNATGVSFFTLRLDLKRLELLRELVPEAATIGMLVNPKNPNAERNVNDVQAVLRPSGKTFFVAEATAEDELDGAFKALVQQRTGALLVSTNPFFFGRRVQIVALSARHSLPAVYEWREYAEAGGLMSYGTSLAEAQRQLGVYAGRILKGEKPTDLPVIQPTRFELVINLKTAKALGLTVPPSLLARADQVIE
jgi:putative ABC transport system substrate-binding protein